MSLLSSSRTLAVTAAATTLLVGAVVMPVASASAAPAPPVIACPQATSVAGFPITARPFVEPVGSASISLTGTLPAGLVYRDFVFGTPSTPQTSTFTVSATVTAGDGSSSSSTATCTMTVKPAPSVSRIAGVDRYAQSVEASRAAFETAPLVYLASGEKYADALSAASIAAEHGAPLLLTPAGAVTPGVMAEISRLRAANVVVVGGPASVSDAALAQVAKTMPADSVVRIGGADRYAVSRNLITHPTFGIGESDEVFVATGATFPDALSASPAAAHLDAPVLLVNGTETALTAAETSVLTGLGATDVHLVGGPNSLSRGLETALAKSFTVSRDDGDDRFEVGMSVIRASFDKADVVYVASGQVFPDALSGGALAGAKDAPLAITQQGCIDRSTAITIGRFAPSSLVLLGGTNTLKDEVAHLVMCPYDF